MTERLRLLVVDDHPVFRRGLLAVLSDAEGIEVVGAVGTGAEADGRTNTEIAGRLVLSDKTVRNHITNLFAKLGVTDRRDAISLAREAGLGAHSGSLPWQ